MASAEIPLDVLFGNPDRVSPQLSPDGTKLAYVAPVEGVLNVLVGSAPASGEPLDATTFSPVTADTDRGIRSYFWAPAGDRILYIQDTGGDENWRLYGVDLATNDVTNYTPFAEVMAQVIKVHKDHPDHILVGINQDNPQLHDVYRLDLATGELTKLVENPGFIGWTVDEQMNVRAAIAPQPDGGAALLVSAEIGSPNADWRPLLAVGQEDALTFGPLGFTADGSKLQVISPHGANAARLLEIDLETGTERVIAEDSTYDIGGAIRHPETKEIQLVSFEREREEITVLDPSIAPDIAALQAVHGGDLNILDRDDDDARWVVAFNTDTGPLPYYLWDRASQTASFLFHNKPALTDYELAEMEPFSYTARDGLTIHGYVTFPVGIDRKNLPTVLNVHGGPWARDAWGLNPEAQWIANRGYACVQVNYRGSTGYGKDFVNAGDRQWGAAMHDDLLDAVDHIVGEGWSDRDRVAIYGGSYGGYAALAGAAFTPDVFCCAVDIVGPSNIITLIESIPPYWAPMVAQFHTRVGNPETEREFLWERSPLSKADQIRIPMLIAQGANDPRVKQAESEQIVAALVDHGIAHQYELYEDEGHGFAKPENRLDFYAKAEAFLAAHCL